MPNGELGFSVTGDIGDLDLPVKRSIVLTGAPPATTAVDHSAFLTTAVDSAPVHNVGSAETRVRDFA